jgi:hypothetical protein
LALRYTGAVVIGFIIRSIWRLLVLALGIGLAYAAAFVAYPYLDKRLPFFIALLVLYVGLAYFALPTLLRTWRLVIRPDHIPLYVTTRDGIPSDPVNIAVIVRSRRQLIKCMQKAGWDIADKANLWNLLREGWASILARPYPQAPLSPLYLFNRPFDEGFQIAYGKNGSPRHRHHVRFWQLIDRRDDHGHFRFWDKYLNSFIGREHMIWIGAATDDNSMYGVRWWNLQPTHRSDPKPHVERDFIIESLKRQNLIKSSSAVKAGEPFTLRGQSLGNTFICDGRLKIIELKSPRLKPTKNY